MWLLQVSYTVTINIQREKYCASMQILIIKKFEIDIATDIGTYATHNSDV